MGSSFHGYHQQLSQPFNGNGLWKGLKPVLKNWRSLSSLISQRGFARIKHFEKIQDFKRSGSEEFIDKFGSLLRNRRAASAKERLGISSVQETIHDRSPSSERKIVQICLPVPQKDICEMDVIANPYFLSFLKKRKVITVTVQGKTKRAEISDVNKRIFCDIPDSLNGERNDVLSQFRKLLCNVSDKIQHENPEKLSISISVDDEDYSDLGEIVQNCDATELSLAGVGLNTKALKSLVDTITDSKVEVLNVSFDTDLESGDILKLPSVLANQIMSLIMSGCDLTQTEIISFESTEFSKLKVNRLDLSYNATLECSAMTSLGKSIKTLCVKELCLAGCELERDHLEGLQKSLKGNEVTNLDISDNTGIGSDIDIVASCVKGNSIKFLNMSDCRLTAKQITLFAKYLEGYLLKEIDLSDRDRVADAKYVTSLCHLIPVVEEKITICFKSVGKRCVEALQQSLDSSENKNLDLRVVYERKRDIRRCEQIQLLGPVKENFLSRRKTQGMFVTSCTLCTGHCDLKP